MKRSREETPPGASSFSATSGSSPPAKKPSTSSPSSASSSSGSRPSSSAASSSGSGAAGSGTSGMPKVQDALGYLDKVKSRYSHSPQVYNQFLDIMKDFKSMAIDTEGVIKRVKSLFFGHRSLILGFNQFLPPGYKIEVDGAVKAPGGPVAPGSASKPDQPATVKALGGPSGSPSPSGAATPGSGSSPYSAETKAPAAPAAAAAGAAGGAAVASAPGALKPTVEFNHAVNYVAKIKHRFRDQPHIYSEFLDILHDYQAKRTIEEVYHRVQKLFGTEPDLLNEFRYFLPENPTQQQAKSGSSSASGGGGGSGMRKGVGGGVKSGSAKKTTPTAATAIVANDKDGGSKASRLVASAQQRVQGKGQPSRQPVGSRKGDPAPSSAMRSGKSGKDGKDKASSTPATAAVTKPPTVTYPPGSEKELAMMDKLHDVLSRSQWSQLVKILNLFACDIVSRVEMIRMIDDLIAPQPARSEPALLEVLDRFKQAIGYDEWEEKQLVTAHQSNYYTFVASVDFTTCPQVTASYRQLPSGLATPYCSGRTALCEAVLNDSCISIPTGSEDFSFKATRKNVYEEQLFKVEDERFELDMVIENNAAVIRVLEPLVESVQNMSAEQGKALQLNENLDILHLRSISRVYGEQGYEMVELLKTCPALTAKIVLQRLHQKDEEWRRVRHEMKNVWRKISEHNYQRSLDHRSFYFKQEDKKRRSPKALVAELKEVHHKVFDRGGGEDEADKDDLFAGLRPGTEESIMLRQIRQGYAMQPLYTYCMHWTYEDDAVHRRIRQLLLRVGRDEFKLGAAEALRLELFLCGFVSSFFAVPVSEDEWREIDRMEAEVREREEKGEAEAEREQTMDVADEEEDEEKETEEQSRLRRKRNNVSILVPPAAAASAKDDGMEVESDAGSVAVGAPGAAAAGKASGAVAAAASKKKKGKRQIRNRQRRPVTKEEKVVDEEEDEEKEDEVEVDVEGGGGRVERLGKKGREEEKDSADDDDQSSSSSANKPRLSPPATAAAASSSSSSGSSSAAHSISSITREVLAAHAGLPSPSRMKPMTVAASTFALDDSLHPPRRHGRPSRLFFCSNAYYVFFRLHHFLYDRLHKAKDLAFKARGVKSKRKGVPTSGEERWSRFNALLDEFVRGEEGPSKERGESRFEDECRNLLGASSYVLFTLDKLVHQLVKQVLALLNSDISMQLLALYALERRRHNEQSETARSDKEREDASARLCRQYHLDASLLLNSDNTVQVEYFTDTREIGIGMVEGLHFSDAQTALGLKVQQWHGAGDLDYQQYMQRYTAPEDSIWTNAVAKTEDRVEAAKAVALRRSFGAPSSLRPDPERGERKALRNYRMYAGARPAARNGLEMKICTKTYKLIYVEDTEDVLCSPERAGRPRSGRGDGRQLAELRSEQLSEWAQSRFLELNPGYVEKPDAVEQDDDLNAMRDDDVMIGIEAVDGADGADEPGDADGGDGDAASESVSASPSPAPTGAGSGQGGAALFNAVAAAQSSVERNAATPSPMPPSPTEPTSPPAYDGNGEREI